MIGYPCHVTLQTWTVGVNARRANFQFPLSSIWVPGKMLYISVVAIIGHRFFLGHIALHCFVHISDKSVSIFWNAIMVFNHFDRDRNSHVSMYVSMYVCMYVCMHVWMYECINVSMYACIYVSMCIYVYVGMHVCMHVCIYVSMYLCIYVSLYLCIYVPMCTYVCMYLSMYVCTYVCMYVRM